MSLSELTDPAAVLTAIHEYDQLGRDQFLQKYGYGLARSYRLEHEGKLYDSKAIADVALGAQFPHRGALRSDQFSGDNHTVRAKLESLGFHVNKGTESAGAPEISSADIRTLSQARSSGLDYAQLRSEQREAYRIVHQALERLGQQVREELGGSATYTLKLTSGFHLSSGSEANSRRTYGSGSILPKTRRHSPAIHSC